jgi:hypothetical protein
MDEVTKVLIEHYQKTYELTYSLWQQRNSAFLILMGVIGLAALLTFQSAQAQPLLVDFIAHFVGIKDSERLNELRAGFPFRLMNEIVLAVIFYLVVNLNHRANYVLRNYKYLARLEHDIRKRSEMSDSVAFTRESTFYWQARSPLGGLVKWVYIGMLGIVLVAFLGGRIFEDVGAIGDSGGMWWVILDVGLAIPTLLFYAEYAWSSVANDSNSK